MNKISELRNKMKIPSHSPNKNEENLNFKEKRKLLQTPNGKNQLLETHITHFRDKLLGMTTELEKITEIHETRLVILERVTEQKNKIVTKYKNLLELKEMIEKVRKQIQKGKKDLEETDEKIHKATRDYEYKESAIDYIMKEMNQDCVQ
tara:strand:- start:1092 stop:1538 length:447 start_codon:yes stop_codon:yes gene_type:complete